MTDYETRFAIVVLGFSLFILGSILIMMILENYYRKLAEEEFISHYPISKYQIVIEQLRQEGKQEERG